ncbi:MAG: hypothetical protein IPJ54_21185 [Saprospiraceae bacterium]|nr:hypothetical protein [Saprospiraceae bacterium]
MAETTEIINDREYFILEASDTPDFAKKEVMAYLRVENERMYALETTGERLVFDYFLFPEEEWKSNLYFGYQSICCHRQWVQDQRIYF